jgi:hypothetical protein
MNYENFSKSELLSEIATLKDQLTLFRLNCNTCEHTNANSSMKLLSQIIGNLPILTFTLDVSGNYIEREGDFSDYFPSNEPSILNFKILFPNYSKNLDLVIDQGKIEFDLEFYTGEFTKIWRHNLQFDQLAGVIIGFAMNITPFQKLQDDLKATNEALAEQEFIMKEAKKLVNFGEWQLQINNNKMQLSDIIYDIFEIDRNNFKPYSK